jgi:hypothetical protein
MNKGVCLNMHQKLINAFYAALTMIIFTAVIVLTMLSMADIPYSSRNWSTLYVFSDSIPPAQHPKPPGAVVVNNNGQPVIPPCNLAADRRPQ